MTRRRKIYRILFIGIFILMNAVILYGIGQLFSYFNTGAERSSILHTAQLNAKAYQPKVIWEKTANSGRPIEKQTLETITANYLQAWYVRNIAYKMNTLYGIDDFYTQSARANILNHIKDQKEKNIHIESSTLQHNLSLDFYSLDGQLAVLTDHNNKQYQRIYRKEELLFENQMNSSYKVILLLEDGFWKIRHLVKLPNLNVSEILENTKPESFASLKNNKITIGEHPFQIRGINYYPQETPWDMFGMDFDIHQITEDFKILKNKGLNTLRIFVGYKDFGKAEVLPEKLNKLLQVLDTAKAYDLKVIVTLFDFYGNYDVLNWTLTHRHAEQIVSRFKNHKAILAWDIKNEPDLDFESRNQTKVLAWLKEMSIQIKKYDPNHLVTIGWSKTNNAHLLKEDIDFVSFHFYEDIETFEESYLELQYKIQKPLVLQEFGLSSNRGLWNPLGSSEKSQAEYYSRFKKLIRKQDIHYLPWTLYDFTKIPASVVGKLPWRKQKQKHFGFIDKNGKHKKAFEFLRP